MPRKVKANGVIHNFPDDATDAEISAALGAIPEDNAKAAPKAQTWSEQLGLNEPTDSMVTGFLRGSGGAAVDMAQGATARIRNAVARSGDPMTREIFGAVPVEQQQDVMSAPDSFAGQLGGMIPDAAAIALPTGRGAKLAYEAIPRTARAGEKFQSVMAAAKNVPLNTQATGDAALRIMQLADRGGSMPLSVRKLLNRLTDPGKAPMAYEEARDFASNISRLSANEFGRLTPVVAREVANLRVTLNQAVANAAKQAGKGDEYAAAMKEYAQAMRLKEAVDTAVKVTKKGLPWATAAGAATWLTRQVRSALGEQ